MLGDQRCLQFCSIFKCIMSYAIYGKRTQVQTRTPSVFYVCIMYISLKVISNDIFSSVVHETVSWCRIYNLWHCVRAQKLSDFTAFGILQFQVREAQPVLKVYTAHPSQNQGKSPESLISLSWLPASWQEP